MRFLPDEVKVSPRPKPAPEPKKEFGLENLADRMTADSERTRQSLSEILDAVGAFTPEVKVNDSPEVLEQLKEITAELKAIHKTLAKMARPKKYEYSFSRHFMTKQISRVKVKEVD